jgi:hypothetical protein
MATTISKSGELFLITESNAFARRSGRFLLGSTTTAFFLAGAGVGDSAEVFSAEELGLSVTITKSYRSLRWRRGEKRGCVERVVRCEKSIFRALLRYKKRKKKREIWVCFFGFLGLFFEGYKWDKTDVKSEVFGPFGLG